MAMMELNLHVKLDPGSSELVHAFTVLLDRLTTQDEKIASLEAQLAWLQAESASASVALAGFDPDPGHPSNPSPTEGESP